MPKLARFDPPGFLRDLKARPDLLVKWSAEVSKYVDVGVGRVAAKVAKVAFYNPTRVSTAPGAAEKAITWPGFPRQVMLRHGADRRAAFREADVPPAVTQRRPVQDEYLEWHTYRDAAGKIVRVDFTCEPPEYWQFLGLVAPALVLTLYRKHVDASIPNGDLFENGVYDPFNRWNSSHGAMHLTQRSNSLSAEVFLAADATVVRRKAGAILTDADALIVCAGYGERNRSSDPRIGADVNALARDGYAITLKNPVGLYMAGIDLTGWLKPDGAPISSAYFKVTRGAAGHAVRSRFVVPAGETANGQPFTVSDITIGGIPVEFGGQIAEAITMRLIGVASQKGSVPVTPKPCGS